MVSEQFNFSGVGLLAPTPNPQLSWRTDDFLSGLSPLADQSQFWSVGNSLFAHTWLSRINVAQEPWRGHACIGLSRDIRHYSSFISMLLSARSTPSRPLYSYGSQTSSLLHIIWCLISLTMWLNLISFPAFALSIASPFCLDDGAWTPTFFRKNSNVTCW